MHKMNVSCIIMPYKSICVLYIQLSTSMSQHIYHHGSFLYFGVVAKAYFKCCGCLDAGSDPRASLIPILLVFVFVLVCHESYFEH